MACIVGSHVTNAASINTKVVAVKAMDRLTPNILDADIHGTMMFRLLFRTQDDRYEPESARAVIEGLKGVDERRLQWG